MCAFKGGNNSFLLGKEIHSRYCLIVCGISQLDPFFRIKICKFGANARDVLYPIPFEAHQASEGAGIQIVEVENQPPQANAGPDLTVLAKTTTTLSGSGTDPDGDALSFCWTQTAGPSAMLAAPSSPTTSFVAPQVTSSTTLTFSLIVDDGNAADTDTVDITVQPRKIRRPKPLPLRSRRR